MTRALAITLFFLILIRVQASAQSLQLNGKILNNQRQPVDLANVVLLATDSVVVRQTSTDSLGKFVFKATPGVYVLRVTYLGNELLRQSLVLSQNTDLGSLTVAVAVELQGVTVTNRRKVIERQFDKIVFNVDGSPFKQGYNALDIIRRGPGMRVSTNGEILLRNEGVQVMVNGRKMNFSPEELAAYLGTLASENIQRIEIQRSGSAETEATGSGGVLNIVLKKVPVGFQSTAKAIYTFRDVAHAGYQGSLNTQFGAAKWNIYNRLNFTDQHNLYRFNSTSNFINNGSRNENKGESGFKNRNFNTTTGVVMYPAARHELGGEFYYAHGVISREGFEDLRVYSVQLLNAVSRNNSIYEQDNDFWNAAINYTYKISEAGSYLKLIGDVGNNSLDNYNEVDTRYSVGNLADNRFKYVTDAASRFYNVQLDGLQKLKNDWLITSGVKLSIVSRENTLNVFRRKDFGWETEAGGQNFRNQEKVWAGYSALSRKWKAGHQLKVGVRAEYTDLSGVDIAGGTRVDRHYLDWFPNLYYRYDLKKDRAFSVAYSRRIARPSFRDLNPFILKQNDFLYQTGNPLLQPQYTDKAELGYELKNQAISLYASITHNLITGVYTATNNVTYYRPENFGKTSSVGIDHAYYGNLTPWCYANLSTGVWYYHFRDGTAHYRQIAFYQSLGTQFKFLKTYAVDLYSSFNSKSQFNVTRAAEQYRLDLSLQKNLFKGLGLIRLACEDVFNTQRDKNLSYYNSLNFRFYQKPITRAYILTMSYTFKNKGKVTTRSIQQGNENKGRL